MSATEDTGHGDLAADIDEMVASTERLQATVRGLDDEAARAQSLLPGWSRAHVATHVARNADGLINLLTWARSGVETPVYPSRDARDADIEAGSTRSPGDLELDVDQSAERLLGAFAEPLSPEALERPMWLPSGSALQGRDVARRRTREVEIHHVDLDAGYTPADWPTPFVERTLGELAPLFLAERESPVGVLVATDTDGRWQVAGDGPELSGPAAALLAWLIGRSAGHDLVLGDGAGPVPPAPRWT